MTPIECALIAIFLSASFRTISRAYMRGVGEHVTLLQVNQIGAVIFLASVLEFPFTKSYPTQAWVLFCFSGMMWTFCAYFDLKSYRHLDISVSVILTSIRYVILSAVGFIVFKESFSLKGAVGIAIIIYSIYLIVDLHSIEFKKGAHLKLIAVSGATLALISDKQLTTMMPPEAVAYGGFLFPAILSVLLWPKKLKNIPAEVKKSNGLILLSPIFLASAYYFYVKAFAEGELTITIAIERTLVVVVFLFGFIFLNERSDLKRRIISSILCVAGAFLVATK